MKLFVLMGVVTLSTAIHVHTGGPTDKTIWDGVYSKEQAARGERTYKRSCGYCHRDNLQGDEGPALVGSRFTFQWRERTLKDLFVTISTTMPDDAPGTLAPDAYADIVSFLLSSNDVPSGDSELPSELEALAAIRFTDKPPRF
jgi:mono/diheme cytochrome c family protein